ncbi:MAG: DUF2892 domain-containing protein [Flavobacteriales bacterium]|nr:MAG: DUF2892 domain-containing protein [Flavobacteriales bacterium]
MKTNMGGIDRVIRFLVAIAAGLLVYFDMVSGTLAYILLAVAGIFILTSLVSFCPLYAVFGMNTCSTKHHK